MATKRKPADRYHHGDLRAAIVASAWKVVSKGGVDALSLRAVAEALGVSHAAPAHHFAGKDGLLDALREEAWRRFADELEPCLNAAEPLRATGRVYVRFATAHPEQMELMFRRGAAPTADARRAWAALSGAVKSELKSQRVDDAVVAWAMVHGLASLLRDLPRADGASDDAVLVEKAITCVVRGLATR